MRIEIENYGQVYKIEEIPDDLDLYELYDIFKRLCYMMTYPYETIEEVFKIEE